MFFNDIFLLTEKNILRSRIGCILKMIRKNRVIRKQILPDGENILTKMQMN